MRVSILFGRVFQVWRSCAREATGWRKMGGTSHSNVVCVEPRKGEELVQTLQGLGGIESGDTDISETRGISKSDQGGDVSDSERLGCGETPDKKREDEETIINRTTGRKGVGVKKSSIETKDSGWSGA
ncbi:hypothetical protein Tco_0711392 [Tanacetum coccineum]